MRGRWVPIWVIRLDRLVDGVLLAAALLVVAAAWYGAAQAPGSLRVLAPADALRREAPVYRVPTQKPWVAFAVNVDWGDEVLPAMLALFEREGIQVTFFPTGRWANRAPELVRAMAAQGHEVGNHGFTHDHPKALSDQALRQMIQRNEELLFALVGEQPRLFAPPYGEVDGRIARVASELGYWTVMWTIDTIDWQRPSPSRIVERVVPRLAPGAIILMHPTQPTLEALPPILEAIRAKGMDVVPVGRLIEEGLAGQELPEA
ncbi:MAG: polysaccharide deacetylase family protein [Firmicutes bacterium]|uniref:polysaccharide deacetylase family protein n=1 Tax=Limnochorda sp. TaxID=1940279 RepID=UPI0018363777|nr:polysaccharide deacetylase family protein [Bacillota bacterium]